MQNKSEDQEFCYVRAYIGYVMLLLRNTELQSPASGSYVMRSANVT